MTPNEIAIRFLEDLEVISGISKTAKNVNQLLAASPARDMKKFAAEASISTILIGVPDLLRRAIEVLEINKNLEALKLNKNDIDDVLNKVTANIGEVEQTLAKLTSASALVIVEEVFGSIHEDAFRLSQADKARS